MSCAKSDSIDEIRSELVVLRDHAKSTRILSGFFAFASLVASIILVFSLAAGIGLPPFMRSAAARWVALILCASAAVVSFVLWVLRPLRWSPSYESLARLAEESLPGLDNSCINAVQLASERRSQAPLLLFRAIDECRLNCRGFDLLSAVDRRPLRRSALAAAAVFALASTLVLAAPASLYSGLLMLLSPSSFVPSVGAARIDSVSPGDAALLRGREVIIEATLASPLESPAEGVLTVVYPAASPQTRSLFALSPTQFRASLGRADLPFDYSLEIAGTQTRSFHVDVYDRPAVKAIHLRYDYPAYTGLPHKSVLDSSGDISAPYGATVTVVVEASSPIDSGSLELPSGRLPLLPSREGCTARASFLLREDALYRIHITDAAQVEAAPGVPHAIKCIPDLPPVVSVPLPGKDVTAAPGSSVHVLAEVSDDYRLGPVAIVLIDPDASTETLLASWPATGSTAASFAHTIEIDPAVFTVGKTYTYYVAASDLNTLTGPRETRSRLFSLRVSDSQAAAAALIKTLESLSETLSRILAAQRLARSHVSEFTAASSPDAVSPVLRAQLDIRSDTQGLAAAVTDFAALSDTRRILETLVASDMTLAVDTCASLARSSSLSAGDLSSLSQVQDRIIDALSALLGLVDRLLDDARQGKLSEGNEIPSDTRRRLHELLDGLQDFLEAQRRIVEATSNLAATAVDDYTDADRDALQNLAAAEEDWSKFLKESVSDLSKLPEQDFANPTLLKDLVETFSEIEMAADALSRKAVTIAVPHEETGLELAEELTTHLEKWLTDAPDRIKWDMEEPVTDVDVPMAELPTDLQDIVGDLMEDEEDLFSDVEDVSSSWADSLDRGAGWDALDGPISNMSAQGVTGNVLPNSSEIAGRSGEGRTGKAHGEFVGDSAVGKGGRRTPTRITPDPFLSGEIDDTSEEAATGATGGGKVSGAGAEGLQGPVPKDLADRIDVLAGRQAAIVSRTQKLDIALRLSGYPNAGIDSALTAMREVEDSLRSGRLSNAMRRRRVLLATLRNTRSVLSPGLLVRKDNALVLPSRLREEIMDSAQGPVPRRYENLLKGYYESLSTAR